VWTEGVRRIDWKDRRIVAKLPKTTLPRCCLPRHALLSHDCMRGRLGASVSAHLFSAALPGCWNTGTAWRTTLLQLPLCVAEGENSIGGSIAVKG
jgi:hypothetical protein